MTCGRQVMVDRRVSKEDHTAARRRGGLTVTDVVPYVEDPVQAETMFV